MHVSLDHYLNLSLFFIPNSKLQAGCDWPIFPLISLFLKVRVTFVGCVLYFSHTLIFRVTQRFHVALRALRFARKAHAPAMPDQLVGKLNPLRLGNNCY
jgi:hypothetical protein